MAFDPTHYRVRPMEERDYADLGEVCASVYPHDVPYTPAELAEHHKRFPQGQVVAEHLPTSRAVGAHFTLRLRMADFHIDDPWDVLTDHATFDDDDPVNGHTLYGADVFVSPDHQHHGLAQALTKATQTLVVELNLWRMVGSSRLPGYGKVAAIEPADVYVAEVVAGKRSDPVLSVHLKDGWSVVKPIYGYVQNDPDSANWSAVIQWINPGCPPPPGFELR